MNLAVAGMRRGVLSSVLSSAVSLGGNDTQTTAARHQRGLSRFKNPLALILLLGLGVTEIARSEPAPAATRDVIFILIDTLRASHLGSYGYGRDTSPFLDSFARENLRFTHAISASPWTSPSVASIFSAVYPAVHGISPGKPNNRTRSALVFDDRFMTLTEILKSNGYRTYGVVGNPWLTEELGYAQGFDEFVSATDLGETFPRATALNEKVYSLLSRHRGPGVHDTTGSEKEPFFLYVHYMEPHKPLAAPARYLEMFSHAPPGHDFSDHDDPKILKLINSYDAEIRYLDSQLAKLFGFFEKNGLLENAVVVISADHGEQIYEYGNRHNHGYTLHNLEVHVPLLMRIPGVPSASIETIVSTVDIHPTILDALDIEIDHPVQGVSLSSELSLRKQRGVYSGMTYWGNSKAFIRGDGKKAILRFGAPQAALVTREHENRLDVYDSITDYRERRPMHAGDLERELRSRFYEIYDRSVDSRGSWAPRTIDLDEEAAEKLRSLGYAE